MKEHNRQSIGVGVFVRRGDKILIGQRGRLCVRGKDMFCLPGGMLEHPETFAQCAIREVREEAGIEVWPYTISDVPFSIPGLLAVTDHFDIDQQRDGNLVDHLSFWMMTTYASGEPEIMEPDKCVGWEWIRPAALIERLGHTCENPTHPQYYWTPAPLWRRILRPWFGVM